MDKKKQLNERQINELTPRQKAMKQGAITRRHKAYDNPEEFARTIKARDARGEYNSDMDNLKHNREKRAAALLKYGPKGTASSYDKGVNKAIDIDDKAIDSGRYGPGKQTDNERYGSIARKKGQFWNNPNIAGPIGKLPEAEDTKMTNEMLDRLRQLAGNAIAVTKPEDRSRKNMYQIMEGLAPIVESTASPLKTEKKSTTKWKKGPTKNGLFWAELADGTSRYFKSSTERDSYIEKKNKKPEDLDESKYPWLDHKDRPGNKKSEFSDEELAKQERDSYIEKKNKKPEDLDESKYPWLDHKDRPGNKKSEFSDEELTPNQRYGRVDPKKVKEIVNYIFDRIDAIGKYFPIDDYDMHDEVDYLGISTKEEADAWIEKMLKSSSRGPFSESQQMREWANSVYRQYDDRGHVQEPPNGETVDLSLRRYLNANAMPVKIEEDHTVSGMLKEYKSFKKDNKAVKETWAVDTKTKKGIGSSKPFAEKEKAVAFAKKNGLGKSAVKSRPAGYVVERPAKKDVK